MFLKRVLWAGIVAFCAIAIAGFLSAQGMAIAGNALFSPLGIILLMAAIFGELTAVSL